MKSRNIQNTILFLCGLLLFSILEFVVIPQQHTKQKNYLQEQKYVKTHDFNCITAYASKYMGDVSNSSNLFCHLPTFFVSNTYENDLDHLGLILHLNGTGIGRANANTIILYNSTAAFALIDNLEYIEYRFTDRSFFIDRDDVEALYEGFSTLLDETTWIQKVRDPLNSTEYVNDISKKIILTHYKE